MKIFASFSEISPVKEEEGLEGFELVDDPMDCQPAGQIKYLDISFGTFTSMFEQNRLKKGEFPGLKYVFTIVESLNMDSCKLDEKDARMIKYCLKEAKGKSTLKALTLSNNYFGIKGARAIATLEVPELDLSNCKLGVGGACAFSKLLPENIVIKKLNLYNNKIKVEGAKFIAKILDT